MLARFAVPSLASILALSIGTPAAAQAGPGKLDDATIVAIFDVANTADIETGALAAKQGASKEVRAMGVRLRDDHTMVRQQGRDLAKKLGVTPTPPNPNTYAQDHRKAMATLEKLHGADFDRAFLDHEIAFHQAVIDAINQTLLPAITNAEVKALVEKVVPAFQSHLAMAQATRKQLGLAD